MSAHPEQHAILGGVVGSLERRANSANVVTLRMPADIRSCWPGGGWKALPKGRWQTATHAWHGRSCTTDDLGRQMRQRCANRKVCVVGAGPAGLAMARALKRLHIEFDVYERHSAAGGIWDQANSGSPIYDSVHFISSKSRSHFLDFEMPADYPDYPSHRQILAYLREFARVYGLYENIHFNTGVQRIEQSATGWKVSLATGETKILRLARGRKRC